MALAPRTEDLMTQERGDSYPKLREVLGEEAFAELAHLIRKTYEANALHAEMRRLMDEYDWAVRGRVGRRPEGPARRRQAQDGPGG